MNARFAAVCFVLLACGCAAPARKAGAPPSATDSAPPVACAAAPVCVPEPAAAPPPGVAAPASASQPVPETPPIVQAGAPGLRSRATEVDPGEIATPAFQELVARMIATMRAAPGVGLAAPQIGVPLRVIVLEDRAELIARSTPAEATERGRVPFGPRVFVNPVVSKVGKDRAKFFEGCLSVAGFAGVVERDLEVEVAGLDEHGAESTWRVRGWPARILQHELDHLDGTLYVDRMDTRSFATGPQAKALYGGKPMAEVLKMLEVPHRPR